MLVFFLISQNIDKLKSDMSVVRWKLSKKAPCTRSLCWLRDFNCGTNVSKKKKNRKEKETNRLRQCGKLRLIYPHKEQKQEAFYTRKEHQSQNTSCDICMVLYCDNRQEATCTDCVHELRKRESNTGVAKGEQAMLTILATFGCCSFSRSWLHRLKYCSYASNFWPSPFIQPP